MKIQDALDLHLKEEASRIIGEFFNVLVWGAIFDILPALLSQRERPWAIGPLSNGDSYGVLQAIHLEESLRWVPASSEMHALPLRAWHG